MYTWEIQNRLQEIGHTFDSIKAFYAIIDTSPQIVRIKAGEAHDHLFEMYIASNDGLNEKVFIKK